MCRCSSGYDLRQYPGNMLVNGDVTLRELNTQVAEQVNALLENIRTQVTCPAMHHSAASVMLIFEMHAGSIHGA